MKKQTLATIFVFLLIIAASTMILNYTKTITQETPKPIALDESNFLEQLSPEYLERGFLDIPWGTLSEDVKGLWIEGEVNYTNYMECYIRPSDRLNFKESSAAYIIYAFSGIHGFTGFAIVVPYTDISPSKFNHKIKSITNFLNAHYSPLKNNSDHTEWENEYNTVSLSYTKSPLGEHEAKHFSISIYSKPVIKNLAHQNPPTLDESSYLEQLSPNLLKKGFLSIPWGTLSEDVEDLLLEEGMLSLDYMNYQNYTRTSDKLRFKDSTFAGILYSFDPDHGLIMALLNIVYSEIDQKNFKRKIQKTIRYFNKHYGVPVENFQGNDKERPTITNYIKWQNETASIVLSYTTPLDDTYKISRYYIMIVPTPAIKEMMENLPETSDFQ